MSERKELGKIQNITFGWGGYQEAEFGLSVTMGGEAWGVGSFRGTWGIARSDHAQWTEEDRVRQLGETALYVRDLLKAAKKQHVAELKGVPVECTFEGNSLKEWRILSEVL